MTLSINKIQFTKPKNKHKLLMLLYCGMATTYFIFHF